MGSVASILFMVLPVAGSMLLVWGVFQVVMDLRTAKQKRVVDRLLETRAATKERQIKESLLRKRGDENRNSLERVISTLQVVSKLQRMLDQADVSWSASRMLVNVTGAALVLFFAVFFVRGSAVAALGCGAGAAGLPILWLLRK